MGTVGSYKLPCCERNTKGDEGGVMYETRRMIKS